MAQRSRVDYNITATPITTRNWPISCASKHWEAAAPIGNYLSGTRRLMLDVVIPRFHQRRKAGEKFFNDMYKEEITVSDAGSGSLITTFADFCPGVKAQTEVGSGHVAVLTPRTSSDSRGNSLPLLATALNPSEITRAKHAVSTETWSKIGTGSSQLWESVAEYNQALSLLQNPITRLKDLSLRLVQGLDRGSAKRNLMKEVSDHYLLFRYGVSPLMKDIKEILKSLDKPGGDMEVTSRARDSLAASRTFPGQTVNGGWTANWQCQVDHFVDIRGMHLDRGYVSLANNYGFDFRSMMLLPLQLTSYSFVADWFSNLSSYVRSTIPAFGWQPLGGNLVTKEVISTTYFLTNVTLSGATLTTAPTGSSHVASRSTTRSILLDPQIGWNSDFRFESFTRTADALALIASRFVKVSGYIGYRPNNSAFHDRRAYHTWEENFFK